MKILSTTIGRYIASNYIRNLLMLTLILLCVVYIFDVIELIRRASKQDDISISLVAAMGLLKMPEAGQVMLPFAVLFSAMFTFWQLSRRSELIIMRASGYSVWQFLTPILVVSMIAGLILIMMVNPLGAMLLGRFKQLENRHLTPNSSQIAVFEEGLWLRQDIDKTGQYAILHAARVSQPDWILKDVTLFEFMPDNSFKSRIDAQTARLIKGRWLLEKASIHNPSSESLTISQYDFSTDLTIESIEESFAAPETMSFWHLPAYIKTLESTGFDATRLKVYYQTLWAQPLLFMAMVLLAACVSMRPPRFSGAFILIGLGVMIGFFVFFISSYLQALGGTQQIPVILAAWSPAIISLLFGLTVILYQEDG